jgi:hypothetical protein
MLKMEALRSFETSIISLDTPHIIPEDLNWYNTVESRWGCEIFLTRPDRPWGPPSLLYNGYRVFPGGKAAGAWR